MSFFVAISSKLWYDCYQIREGISYKEGFPLEVVTICAVIDDEAWAAEKSLKFFWRD